MKINVKFIAIIIFICIIIVWGIPTFFLNKISGKYSVKDKIIYNILDVYEEIKNLNNIEIETNLNNDILVNDELTLKVINKYENYREFKYEILLNGEESEQIYFDTQIIEFKANILNEGINRVEIVIFKEENEILKKYFEFYFIKAYQKQFLDEKEKNGISVHYRNGTMENAEKSVYLLKNLGNNEIRTDFMYRFIALKGYYDYTSYDKWIKVLEKESNLKIIPLFNGIEYFDDRKINSEEEIKNYIELIKETLKRYPQIEKIEILNEVNQDVSYKGAYLSKEELKWYNKLINTIYKEIPNVEIIMSGTVMMPKSYSKGITSKEYYTNYFLNNIECGYLNYVPINIHLYSDEYENNKEILEEMTNMSKLVNDYGGFNKIDVSEYGFSDISNLEDSENRQANKLVQYSVLIDKNGINTKILYDSWDLGNDKTKKSNNYGLFTYDYKPKMSYYAMKNYYENTNGAEYLGTVNISDGLESHVYDKDGKPVIITWSENSTNNIQIDYKDFTAKDLYGKDIQPDENGKLTITTSPVYLYDLDYNYFYKAISNVATSKYDEFKEKFTTEISQISGFEEKINQRQNYIQSVANTQKLMQNTAITAMKSHYELGDIILKAYEEGQLKVESVKISSMLDMINDIGNSYEDLVTVSVNNTINSVMKTLDEANVDSSELTITKQKIDETENLINTNTDVEIIYPTKILQFSKDCYEKADYINSLEEQNDIKAGLIISNNLHAQLLANWANKFASIQINNNINEYIAQNSVTIEYSETNITNKSVKATIKTNAEIQITNNSNSKEYVFDQNGSFTFEYTIKGQAKQITAKVTNIDKTSPIINGVIDGKLYTSKITPTITDENLDTIKLILNGEEVKNFKSGTTLTEEGFYTLTAIDKAGNKTQISFQIMENNNQNYIIQDNIIKNISEQTKKSDFDNKLKLEITYKIARNDEEINEKDNIATGDVLTTSAGDKYTLIVTGDLNKDGKLDLKDLVKMRKYFLDGNNLDENEILAADCNFDGKINLKDLVKMRLMLLNQDATK